MNSVVIIDFGAGNVRSVSYAVEKMGWKTVITSDCNTIQNAEKVIFPGVGEARTAMRELKKRKLSKLIPKLNQPVLGICLGMQLLCKYSFERNTSCLGIIDVEVQAFNNGLKVPQMGWNALLDVNGELFNDIRQGEYVYYANSYYVPVHDTTVAISEYGIPISAAIQMKNFYGCQFHPEKSSEVGLKILRNFLEL